MPVTLVGPARSKRAGRSRRSSLSALRQQAEVARGSRSFTVALAAGADLCAAKRRLSSEPGRRRRCPVVLMALPSSCCTDALRCADAEHGEQPAQCRGARMPHAWAQPAGHSRQAARDPAPLSCRSEGLAHREGWQPGPPRSGPGRPYNSAVSFVVHSCNRVCALLPSADDDCGPVRRAAQAKQALSWCHLSRRVGEEACGKDPGADDRHQWSLKAHRVAVQLLPTGP